MRYASDTLTKLDAAYSASFWMRNPAASLGNLYRLGDTTRGFNIISRGRRVSLVLWRPTFNYPNGACTIVGVDLPPGEGWRHLAFSADPKPQRETEFFSESAAGVVAYLDGRRIQTQALERFETSGPTANVGGADRGRDENCQPVTLPSYDGELSDLQLLKAPITAPQAAQLASRYANAAEAVYSRRELTFAPGRVTDQDGYQVWTTDPIALDSPIGEFGAFEMQFTADFGVRNLPRWRNPRTLESDPDCEFVLGGVEARNRSRDGPTDPVVALFCFSPTKIADGLTPFTLSFFYPNRTDGHVNPRPVDLLIWEPLATKSTLGALANFPQIGLDLKITFRVSISAYNVLVQAKTYGPPWMSETPNFVSPIYQGAHGLVDAVFGETDQNVVLFTPKTGVSEVKYFFIDQRQQLDDFDAKLAKGY